MKTLFWMTASIVAWLLIAGFAWQYSSNIHRLKRIEAKRAEDLDNLEAVRERRDALEKEALAIASDPFYVQKLLRERGWVRVDEMPVQDDGDPIYERDEFDAPFEPDTGDAMLTVTDDVIPEETGDLLVSDSGANAVEP